MPSPRSVGGDASFSASTFCWSLVARVHLVEEHPTAERRAQVDYPHGGEGELALPGFTFLRPDAVAVTAAVSRPHRRVWQRLLLRRLTSIREYVVITRSRTSYRGPHCDVLLILSHRFGEATAVHRHRRRSVASLEGVSSMRGLAGRKLCGLLGLAAPAMSELRSTELR